MAVNRAAVLHTGGNVQVVFPIATLTTKARSPDDVELFGAGTGLVAASTEALVHFEIEISQDETLHVFTDLWLDTLARFSATSDGLAASGSLLTPHVSVNSPPEAVTSEILMFLFFHFCTGVAI